MSPKYSLKRPRSGENIASLIEYGKSITDCENATLLESCHAFVPPFHSGFAHALGRRRDIWWRGFAVAAGAAARSAGTGKGFFAFLTGRVGLSDALSTIAALM